MLVAGFPGRVNRHWAHLAEKAGFELIRSDLIRRNWQKCLERQDAGWLREGNLLPEWTNRNYTECLKRAESFCLKERVLVDANFRDDARRQAFLRQPLPGACAILICEPVLGRLQECQQRCFPASPEVCGEMAGAGAPHEAKYACNYR